LSNSNRLIGTSRTSMMDSKERSKESAFWKTELYTKVIGSSTLTKKTAEAFKFGQMDQGTMVSGKTAWLMVTEDSYMLKETFTRVNGSMTRPMVMVFTLILMEVDMKGSGSKISNMDWDLNSGLMVLSMKACTNRG